MNELEIVQEQAKQYKDMEPNVVIKKFKQSKSQIRKLATAVQHLVEGDVITEDVEVYYRIKTLGKSSRKPLGIKIMTLTHDAASDMVKEALDPLTISCLERIIEISSPWVSAFEMDRKPNGAEGKSLGYLP